MPSSYRAITIRIREDVLSQLQEIARAECEETDRHVSVSDLIRAALREWLRTRKREPGTPEMPAPTA